MGYKIKELREAMKMTQEELAEKSGVSRDYFCPRKWHRPNDNLEDAGQTCAGARYHRRPYFFYQGCLIG